MSTRNLRVVVHDYGGHPFTFDLCEALAERGYTVLYVYTSACRSPNAQFGKRHKLFRVKNIVIPDVKKENFVARYFQESAYGDKVVSLLKRWRPDVIISSTTPLAAQRKITKWSKRRGILSVFWFQDIISVAAQKILPGKLGMAGAWVALWMERMERKILRRSSAVITISDDFNIILKKWKISGPQVVTIPNWAVIDKLPVLPKDNAWATEHGLADKFCFVYTGTLGMKHNPGLLISLAQYFSDRDDVRIVVISEKMGADWLRQEKSRLALNNLIILNFQPFEKMPQVLATADVLISILNEDASEFCVPSKVLSYLCASRPLLLAVARKNLAARIVSQNEAGLVVAPDNTHAFLTAATMLYQDALQRQAMGESARQYAQSTFITPFNK